MIRRLRLSLLSVLLLTVPLAAAEVANRVILRVNDRIATLYDYQLKVADRLRSIRSQPGIDPAERQQLIDDSPTMVMKEILDELLMLSRADQLGIVASELEIDDAVARMRERAGVETDDQFRAALAQAGLSLEDLRAQLAQQLAWDEVVGREIVPRIQVDDEVLRRFYDDHPELFRVPEQIHVKEIVVLEEGSTPSAVQELAAAIHAELVAGDSLENAAAKYQPQVSAVIDVGWVAPGDLAPSLESALWTLGEGELSPPIAGRGGLHLARVIERKPAEMRPFNDVKPDIRRRERQRLYVEEAERYLEELEAKAYIIGEVPSEAADFRTASGRALRGEAAQLFRIIEAGDGEDGAEDEAVDDEREAAEEPPP